MDALKSLKAKIRGLIDQRTRDGVIIHAAWLTTEVMGEHTDFHGTDSALYVILAHKALGEIVKECIGKYEPKAQTDGQLTLPGFDHVQSAYPVVRGGERVLVPTDLLTDEEIEDRCEDLRIMARGCIAHVKELEAFRDMRRASQAEGFVMSRPEKFDLVASELVAQIASECVSVTEAITALGLPSPGRISAAPGKFSGVPFDMHGFQRAFPGRFAAWLNVTMKDHSNDDLATFFSKDESTIRNWKAAKVAPSGYIVAYVAHNYPDAIPHLMGGS